MHPELFKVFGWPIRTWALFLLLALFVAWLIGRKRAEKFGIPKEKISDLAVWMLVAGVIGARLAYVLLEWSYYSKNLGEIVDMRKGGMTSFGGYLFGLFAIIIWARIVRTSALRTTDLAAVPVLVAIGIGRIGCFFNGCCYGGHCDLPWAVVFPESPGPVHPAQLYDALMAFAAAGLLYAYERRLFAGDHPTYRPGLLTAACLVLLGVTRFVYEMFRAGSTSEVVVKSGNLTLAQIASVAIALFGVAWLIVLQRRKREIAA